MSETLIEKTYSGVFTVAPRLQVIDSNTQTVLVKNISIGEIKKVKDFGGLIFWQTKDQLYRTPEEAGLALILNWVESLDISSFYNT